MYCFTEICIVCLKKNNNLQDIKENSPRNKQLLRKLKYCHFDMEWIKSCHNFLICQNCTIDLQLAYDFVQMCSKNNKVVQDYLSVLKNDSVLSTDIEARLNVILPDVTQDSEDTYSSFLDAGDEYERQVGDEYERQVSEEALSSVINTDYSGLIKIEIEEHSIFTDEEPIDTYLINYEDIKKEITINEDSHEHSINCEDEFLNMYYKCTICNKLFDGTSKFTRHMVVHNNEAQTGNNFLNCEINTSSAEHYYECTVCSIQFNRKSNLIRHMATHGQPYEIINVEPKLEDTTDDGSLEFILNSSSHAIANKSMLTHVGRENFECPICKKLFRRKSHLTRHVNIHSDHKLYSCSFCNKQCNDVSNFKRHLFIHTGYNHYTCPVCNAPCGNKISFKRHLWMLHGQKLYK